MIVLTRTTDGNNHEIFVYSPEQEEQEIYWVVKGSHTIHIGARAEAIFYDGMARWGDDFPKELDVFTVQYGVNSYDELKQVVDEHIQDEYDSGLRR